MHGIQACHKFMKFTFIKLEVIQLGGGGGGGEKKFWTKLVATIFFDEVGAIHHGSDRRRYTKNR
jgi:hypothetical protein